MILETLKSIKGTRKELRNFGFLIGVVLALIAALVWWKDGGGFLVLLGCGAAVVATGLVVPVALRPAYKGWMLLAAGLNWVMTRLILGVLFYLVITPIGTMSRLFGKGFLDAEFKTDSETYWNYRKEQPGKEQYEQQF